MLRRIHITNFILIDQLELHLNGGLTTMSGETGAGKSILLGALEAGLGGRIAAKKVLKNPEEKAVVELEIALNASFKPAFEALDLDFEDVSTFRRELLPNGKSRFFVNDTPAKASDVVQLATEFIDINSQSDTGLLHRRHQQLELIDTFGVALEERAGYQRAFKHWQQLRVEWDQLQQQGATEDVGYLEFLLAELLDKNIVAGEEEMIESELKEHKNSGALKEQLFALRTQLQEEGGAFDQFYLLEQRLEKLADLHSSYESHGAFLSEAIDQLRSLDRRVEQDLSNLEDGVDLDALQARKSELKSLMAKHRVLTTVELIDKCTELQQKVDSLQNRQSRLETLEVEIAEAKSTLEALGESLQAQRLEASAKIEQQMPGFLERVDLPKARLELRWEKTAPTALGTYSPVFSFSANPGQALMPLTKVASGGEQSRVMLALKAVLGQYATLSTQIFDEIDTGISGGTAEKVGLLLSELSQKQQIIAITHLPQVAAKGAQHWLVYKDQGEDQTTSHVRTLSADERIDEIARMLSGEQITESAKKQAKELLFS